MLISIQCELRIDLMRRTWETEAHNHLWNKNKVMMWNLHYCLGCRKQVQLQSWRRFNQKCPEFNGAASGCSAVAMATLNGKLHGNLKSICKRRSGRPPCLQYLVSYDLGQHPGVYSKQSRNLKKNRRHFYECECDEVLLPWQNMLNHTRFIPNLLFLKPLSQRLDRVPVAVLVAVVLNQKTRHLHQQRTANTSRLMDE